MLGFPRGLTAQKGETVEALRLAPEEACTGDMLVLIRWQDRNVAIPLSQLTAIDEDESTDQGIADWQYVKATAALFQFQVTPELRLASRDALVGRSGCSLLNDLTESQIGWGKAARCFSKAWYYLVPANGTGFHRFVGHLLRNTRLYGSVGNTSRHAAF
jgi:hypothetical protein